MDKGFEKFMSTAIGQTGIQTSPVNADAVLVDAMTKGIISVGRKKDDGDGLYFTVDIVFATLANTFNGFQDTKLSTVMQTVEHAVNGSFMSVEHYLGKRYSTTAFGNKENLRSAIFGMLMLGLNASMKHAIKTTDIVAAGFVLNFERGSLMHKLISIGEISDDEIAKILTIN